MAKIENTTVYPLTTPSVDDFIIGTDTSDENRTVSFSIESITATSLLQGLQSVLETSSIATQNISLTGNITVSGTVYPTTITAQGSTGTAGQLLSSTATGIQWVDVPINPCCTLDDTLTVGNTTTQDIITSGSIGMIGASQGLSLINSSVITLGNNCSITTDDDIRLNLATCVLDFNAGASISDGNNSLGTSGQIFTRGPAGVEWSTGIPSASMPTLQQVLTAGDTANANPMNLTVGSTLTLDGTSNIVSAGDNSFTGTNTFSANGTLITTAGVVLSGSLWDGASTGTAGQVLTSTSTGVAWADAGATANTQNLQSVLGFGNTATNDILLTGSIIPTTITDGAASVGTNLQYLSSTGTGLAWVTLPVPTSAVSDVSFLDSNITSLGPPLVISPTAGNVVVEARAYGGGALTGYVPDSGSVTEFLQGDGTWAVPAGGSAPEWVTVEKAITSKVSTTANDYYYNGNPGDPGFPYNWADHQTTSPLGATNIPDINLAGNILASNPGKGTCTSSYPNHQMCELSWVLTGNAAAIDTWTFELWKWNADASGSSVLAATDTQAIASGTASYTGTMTIQTGSNQNILSPGEIYYLTMRPTSILSNSALCLTLTFAWTGVV